MLTPLASLFAATRLIIPFKYDRQIHRWGMTAAVSVSTEAPIVAIEGSNLAPRTHFA